ncbi:MAG: murein biosynthesis integral membrane protein MurJ [Peptostreptococcaceae bacterium]
MSKVVKYAASLMAVTILAKIIGFGREQVLSYAYGASMYTDIYIMAMNIPNVIFAAIGAALSTTFIPIYCDISENQGEKEANKFTNNILMIVLIMCLIIAIFGLIFTKPMLKLFAFGFSGETLSIAINFTRILIGSVIFIGIANVLTSYLQVKNNFTVPGLISLPQNIIVIISIIISIKHGPYAMVWGTLIGMSMQVLFQLPFAYKAGYKIKPYLNLKDKNLKKMLILTGPVLIGVTVHQVNTMIDRSIASTLGEGAISALNFADRLNSFVLALFITSIAAVIYPMLSKLSTSKNKEMFGSYIVKSSNSIILLVMPVAVGAIILATPIVRLLFERGAFDETATQMTSIALVMYSVGLVAYGLRDIINKVFYSLQDTKTPMIYGVVAMGLNIIFNIILSRFMGHAGLALGTSLSAIICTILLYVNLGKKIGDFGQSKIIKTFIKSLAAAIIMGIITKYAYNYIDAILGSSLIDSIISLGSSILIGAIVYAVIIIILKVDEVSMIKNMIKQKLKR